MEKCGLIELIAMETNLPSSSVAMLLGDPLLVYTRKMLALSARVGDVILFQYATLPVFLS